MNPIQCSQYMKKQHYNFFPNNLTSDTEINSNNSTILLEPFYEIIYSYKKKNTYNIPLVNSLEILKLNNKFQLDGCYQQLVKLDSSTESSKIQNKNLEKSNNYIQYQLPLNYNLLKYYIS